MFVLFLMFLDLESEPIHSRMDVMYALVAFSIILYAWNYCLEVIVIERSGWNIEAII